MPRLNCSVSNCSHNTDHCCSLNNIEIDGAAANCCDDTCCNCVTECSSATNALNVTGYANPEPAVGCEAHNCVHNSAGSCKADFINISGLGASNCVGTECSSFCER
ncbi:MAG: hypothetical protein BEN19_05085 [Epulopiscium sp. Nuni2H_MBin003]|nr:MAG: hypothetical protein BEN19_05085 [Epulopiscium sp. Nuni2H_MBin003]